MNIYIPTILLMGIAIAIVSKRGKRSSVSVSRISKKLAIPFDTQGFLSGNSIYAKDCVYLSEELVYVPEGHPSKSISIRYEDISAIRLHGWLTLRFGIRTKTDDTEINITPIIQFIAMDGRTLIVSD